MIYIINKNIEHDLIEKILEYLNISFEYIELNEAELDNLIKSKNYTGLFLAAEFSEYLKKIFPKKYSKLFKNLDYIYLKDDEIIQTNIEYYSFINFIKQEGLILDSKRILLLGSSKHAISVYNALKSEQKPIVFISTITVESDTKLFAGDRKIKKIEISNLSSVDYIINTTELGNIKCINSCMIDRNFHVDAKVVIDLLVYPIKTNLLRQYEIKNSKIYSGLYLLIYKVIYALNINDLNISYKKVHEIFDYLVNDLNSKEVKK